MYKIIIKNLKIFAFHGVYEEEKQNGQDFILDIKAWVNAKPCDDVSKTVDYSSLAKFSKNTMLKQKYNLIETAADVLASEILEEFVLVKEIKILIKKPNAKIELDFEYMAAEVTKKR